MKKLLSLIALFAISSGSYAGGAMADSHGNHASSAKTSSGVHFYGRMYVGYDKTSGNVQRLDDGGNKSRLGLKIRSGNIVGNLEYKFDIGDGTNNDGTNCSSAGSDCRTFDLHIGNLGFMTPMGYIGAGTFESPYKTMGFIDNNMDTAIALNSHGGQSMSNSGVAGTFEGGISYHLNMGPIEFGYMYAASDNSAPDNTNTDRGDFSVGVTFKDMIVNGLTFGYAAFHDNEVSGGDSESNDRFFAKYKVLPNLGVFIALEDLEVANSFKASSNRDGQIDTYGIHYSMGIADIQLVHADGDAKSTVASEDYETRSYSAKVNLSKHSDIIIGYTKQDFDAGGSDTSTTSVGLTHKF